MLNFISPWMTQLTREIHDGKREPQRNMTNRKPSAGRKCGRVAALRKDPDRLARVVASINRHLERHPNDKVRERYRDKLAKQLESA